jgi:hypothetical protein
MIYFNDIIPPDFLHVRVIPNSFRDLGFSMLLRGVLDSFEKGYVSQLIQKPRLKGGASFDHSHIPAQLSLRASLLPSGGSRGEEKMGVRIDMSV